MAGTVLSSKNLVDGTVPSSKNLVDGTSKKSGRGEGGEEKLSPASVGSRAGGDNRKRARSAQMRVGPTASAPAPGSPVRPSFP